MCTAIRFNSKNGELYFGRNLDWTTGFGEKVVITPRNYQYPSAFLGELTPHAGAIIGMAVVSSEVPLYFDCANESGLAIAGLNFPDYTFYEKSPLPGKTNVAAYEFPLWATLNFSTVIELEAALKSTTIVGKPISSDYSVSPLHYLISDRSRAIVVEYTQNGLEIHENPVGVLTNVPTFPEQMKTLVDSATNLPGGWSSPDRFVRAAFLNRHYPEKQGEDENILRLFHTLAGVSMIEGAVEKPAGFEKTIYTGGYSTASKTYYYNTYENPAIFRVSLSDYDLDAANLIYSTR